MKGLLFPVYREIVLGGHLLALGTASIAYTSSILMNHSPALDLLLMAYLFSYGAYTINRSAEMDQDALSNPSRTEYLQRRRRYLPGLVVTCFGLGYALAALRSLTFFVALLAPLLLSLMYSIGSKKLKPIIGVKKLKERLFVKNIVISFGWSLIPVLVGLYYQEITSILLLFAPYVFLRLMVNTIFFDVRDKDGDKKFGIRTLPTVYGIRASFAAMTTVDLLSGAYIIALVALKMMPIYMAFALFLPAYSALYRWLASRPNADINILCDTVADGEYAIWGPLMHLGRIIF
ncbi:MAG: UbiA family prenyltransferase [Thaumarchaeota archaeon]|nr:UbiA family prenyltransferase [Nitrososphaerota archaeon]